MNKIILLGRITKDLEIQQTSKGTDVLQFSIAVTRNYKNNEGKYDADFINCVAYKGLATIINQHFKKGDRILLEGKLNTDKYEKDGETRYSTKVIVENIDFIEKKEQQQDIVKLEEVELTDGDLPF